MVDPSTDGGSSRPLPTTERALLHKHLEDARDALIWKVEGLVEDERRRPITPTGTNLVGLVETVRHAGHSDIIREMLDGATGGRTSPSGFYAW